MRSLVFLFLALTAVAQAAPATPSEPILFTAHELAQGYRETVVIAKPRADAVDVERAEAAEGLRVRQRFSRVGNVRVLELDGSEPPGEAIARLRATGRYEFVEPDYIVSTAVEPNEAPFQSGQLWGLRNTGVQNGVAGADIDVAPAWDIIREAPEVVVAIIDTGANLTHQDLAPNLWRNPSPTFNDIHGARFIGGVQGGTPTDDNGHGTHIAGTIGAVGNNGIGIAGIAWRVKIMVVKSFNSSGSGAMSDIVAGINYAIDHGAHIINGSYGLGGITSFSDVQFEALTAARNAGIIFVAAAGNSAANLDVARAYPASHALDNLVSVGNSTRRDDIGHNSNYGAAVDLFAPGSEILSLAHSSATGTTSLSGTSMAAPHVTGALALLKARFPADTYRQLINRLLRGVDRVENFVGKSQTGGRLNLLNALNTANDANGNRPFNDDFARRPRLNASNVALRAHNGGATGESGEPVHAVSAGRNTIWWEWVAPIDSTVSVNTSGSAYDTVLAVYTGGAVNALTPVAANDDADGGVVTSRVAFTAVAGTSYQIAVEGKTGQAGLTLLNLGTTPSNDSFASAKVLTGISVHVTADNPNSSRESGEPSIQGWPGGLSLWYRWTAPRSGRFHISTTSADFDPLLGIYTGTNVAALTAVATDLGTSDLGAMCVIEAVAGTSYAIVVDSRVATDFGRFTLTLSDALWQAEMNDSVTSAAAIGSDGTIYVGSTDRFLYALRPDGTRKWTFLTDGAIDVSSPALASDGTIYVAAGYTGTGALYALNPDGTLRWRHNFSSMVPAANSPAVGVDGTIYIKPSDGYLYAIDPLGAEKWRYNVNGRLSYASPTVAKDGTIYIGSEDRKLYALRPDGTLRWTFTADEEIYTAPALDAAGNLYFTVLTLGHLYSLTPDGALRWVYRNAAVGSSSSPAISADGETVYFGGYDSKLHAVKTATGERRWAYTLGGEVRASSPAVDANGVIYIGSYDYKLYAINFDGTLQRTWSVGNWIRSSPTIHGTTVYVGSNDHRFYAFDIGTGPAGGPWPQYRQNVRRLGRGLASPIVVQPPANAAASVGGTVTLNSNFGGDFTAIRWQHNGVDVPGKTGATLNLSDLESGDAGLYTAVATNGTDTVTTAPAIVGVAMSVAGPQLVGAGRMVAQDIVHENHNVYDQALLEGAAATIRAHPGQVVRMSFVDLQDDIVQVEFSGAGALTVTLDAMTGPAAPVNYEQPEVQYRRGHARIVVTGADATTHLMVFSVGRITAVNQTLFRDGVAYDGLADIASVAILSSSGTLGGLYTGNTSYFGTNGITGVYAPGVRIPSVVPIGNISAADAATPTLVLGSQSTAQINGGDLWQENSRAIQLAGVAQLRFVDGQDSHGGILPAQANRGRLEQDGADVTSAVVVNPAP